MEPAVDLNADFEEGHAGLARAAARLGDEATVTKAIEAGLKRRSDLRGDLLAEHSSASAILGDRRRARQLAVEASPYEAVPMNLALAWASVGDDTQIAGVSRARILSGLLGATGGLVGSAFRSSSGRAAFRSRRRASRARVVVRMAVS